MIPHPLSIRGGHPISTALRIARLRLRFGLSSEAAAVVADLAYGEGRS